MTISSQQSLLSDAHGMILSNILKFTSPQTNIKYSRQFKDFTLPPHFNIYYPTDDFLDFHLSVI